MAIWCKPALSYPVSLLILIASQTTEAFVLHNERLPRLSGPQLTARTENLVTLDPYIGHGAPPVPNAWNLLRSDSPIQYTPTASNSTIRLTLKDRNAHNLPSSSIYNLTVLGLVDTATSTAASDGNEFIWPKGQGNATFATSYPPSSLQFTMTATDYLPIYVVANVLRAIQDLTHYLYFLDLVFEVFNSTSPTASPIASGCLASNCDSQAVSVESRGLEYANFSATNFTSASSRRLSSIGPVSLQISDELQSVAVAYDVLQNPLSIPNQSFADVADRILANITDLIIANQGDGLLPPGNGDRRLFHYVDTWGSTLGVSLLPINLPGKKFTLGQAAMALKAIQIKLSSGPMVESRLRITLDGSMIGWGCVRYTNTSSFRCLMPTPWTGASTGSQAISDAGTVISDPSATS